VGNTTSFREWSELNGVALLWTIVVPSCIVALWWAPSVRTYARQRGAPPGDASPSQSTPSPKA
jgi:heme/copper-type cytochrome/quinol oxidase subunit 2